MKKILLLSDTHSSIELKLNPYLEVCDEIWHAGDFGNIEVVEWLEGFGKEFRGVYGNIDGKEIRAIFPEDLIFEVEGFKIWMTHIAGYPGKYNPRVRRKLEEINPNLLVCGHSHILKAMQDAKYNLWSLNPGAAGREGFHKVKTALSFDLENSNLLNFRIIELGLRGQIN